MNGIKYFECTKSHSGSLIKLNKRIFGSSLLNAYMKRYMRVEYEAEDYTDE